MIIIVEKLNGNKTKYNINSTGIMDARQFIWFRDIDNVLIILTTADIKKIYLIKENK